MSELSLYLEIKALAKEHGITVKDLLALSPANDPFYAGTPADVAMANWFADVWAAAGYEDNVHLRRAHYWCVSQRNLLNHRGDKYNNTDKDWKYLTQAAKMARYLGLVGIEQIADNKNPPLVHEVEYSKRDLHYGLVLPDLDEIEVQYFGRHIAETQPYHLEIWVEKSTMNDVLAPIAETYHANLVTFEGETSITAVYDAARRIQDANKSTRIFYISDFDPAGLSMPVAMSRKLEYMFKYCDMDMSQADKDALVIPVALTREQVEQFDLPRTPIKKSERRAAKFEKYNGTGAVELDALEALYPNALRDIVIDAIAPYWDEDKAQVCRDNLNSLASDVRVQINRIKRNYQDEFEAVREAMQELQELELDLTPYQTDTATPLANDPDAPLFDSKRDYVDQILHYKAHKSLIDLDAINPDMQDIGDIDNE